MAINYQLPKKPMAGDPMRVGWADSVVRSMGALRPVQVPGMLISRGMYGTRYTPTASPSVRQVTLSELLPFTIRWYDYGEDDGGKSKGGEWQIYLPLGCLTLEQDGIVSVYVSKNVPAKDEDGNRIPAWYHLDEPQSSKDATIVELDDRIVKSYPVYLCMKPWPRVLVSGDDNAMDSYGRVMWKIAVGNMNIVEYSNEDTPTQRFSERTIVERSIAKKWDISKPFSIKYEMAPEDSDSRSATPKMWLINQKVFLGRLEKIDAEDEDITDWKDVWVKITHSTDEFTQEVATDLEGSDARSDDDKTVYQIYTLEDKVVVTDDRDTVPDMNFYTSAPETAQTP